MLINIEDAKETLRLDGDDNDEIIIPLLEAIPSYLEVKTGRTWDKDKKTHPLAQTAAGFILRLWYDPQDEDTEKLKRTIDNLLMALAAIARDKA